MQEFCDQKRPYFCLDSDITLMLTSVSELRKFLSSEVAHSAAFQEPWYFTNELDSITHRWIFPQGEIIPEDCLASTVVTISGGNYLYSNASWLGVRGCSESVRALAA